MVGPRIGAWIKKTGKRAVRRNRSHIRAFVPIAENARYRQIFQVVGPSMFDADDVIDLKCEKAVILVREAIFAKTVRSGPREKTPLIANGIAHGLDADEPALWPTA